MSVKQVSLRGRPYWEIRVIRDRGAFNRRRYLDRRKHLKTEAKTIEAEMIAEYKRAEEVQSNDNGKITAETSPSASPELGTPTFAEFTRRYLAVQDPTRSDYRNKERDLRNHLVPALGHLRLDQIGRPQIDALRSRFRAPTGERATSRRSQTREEAPVSDRRKGKGLSPKTINNILGLLRTVLVLAAEYELIDRTPRIKMERVAKRDPKFLDFDEAEELLAATPSEWRVLVLTAIRAGLRQGELQELRWGDIILTEARAYVRVARSLRRGIGCKLEVKTTKGARPRSVPLSLDLAKALASHRGVAGDDDLVFPNCVGGYFRPNRFRRVIARAAKDAELGKHVHPHMLRHTFASHAMMRGVPVQVIQKWLGHANVTTTERYAHLRPDTGDDLIDLLVPASPTPSAISAVEIGDNTGDNTATRERRTPSTAM